MDAFITYEGLPINHGGAHSLGNKPIQNIYSQIKKILQNFSNSNQATEIDLIFYSSQDGTYKTLPILWALAKEFGIPSYKKWDMVSYNQHLFNWRLSQKDIEKGLMIVDKFSHLPKNKFGPITLSLKWHFHFISQESKLELKGQNQLPIIDSRNHNSQLYVRFGQKSTISAWFAFPFETLDKNAYDYISRIVQDLPFKPSEKHWRIWQKSSKGNWTPKVVNIEFT